MCSPHLTQEQWAADSGSSHGLPVGAGIRTHNLGLPRVSSPTLYPLGQRLPIKLVSSTGTVSAFKLI